MLWTRDNLALQIVPGQPRRLRVGEGGFGRDCHAVTQPDGRQRTPSTRQGEDTGDTRQLHHSGPSW